MLKKLSKLFEDLLYLPSKVEKDKLGHFFGSSLLLFLSLIVFNNVISYAIVLASVFFKDFVWDRLLGKGVFSWGDVLYGSLPVLFHIVNGF